MQLTKENFFHYFNSKPKNYSDNEIRLVLEGKFGVKKQDNKRVKKVKALV